METEKIIEKLQIDVKSLLEKGETFLTAWEEFNEFSRSLSQKQKDEIKGKIKEDPKLDQLNKEVNDFLKRLEKILI